MRASARGGVRLAVVRQAPIRSRRDTPAVVTPDAAQERLEARKRGDLLTWSTVRIGGRARRDAACRGSRHPLARKPRAAPRSLLVMRLRQPYRIESMVLHLAGDQHPLARLLAGTSSPCADARHYAADAAFGEKRDAGARTSHQCRTLVGLQQLFESEGMSAIEIERPAVERQGEGRRAAGSLDKSAKRLHPGSRFLGSATSIRSVPRLGPPLRSRRCNHQLVRRPSPLMGQSMRSVLQGGRTVDSSSGRREH